MRSGWHLSAASLLVWRGQEAPQRHRHAYDGEAAKAGERRSGSIAGQAWTGAKAITHRGQRSAANKQRLLRAADYCGTVENWQARLNGTMPQQPSDWLKSLPSGASCRLPLRCKTSCSRTLRLSLPWFWAASYRRGASVLDQADATLWGE